MSSKAITEKPDSPSPPRWEAPREAPPSFMTENQPIIARVIGGIGFSLIFLGGLALILNISQPRIISSGWGIVSLMLGFPLLLFHAVNDAEYQVRRGYMAVGYLLLLVGAFLAVVPVSDSVGGAFLPFGMLSIALALLFLLCFLRHETDAQMRQYAIYVLGGAAAVMAVSGFLVGFIYSPALFTHALFLVVLGLCYACAFITIVSSDSDLGYYAGLGTGGLGLLAVLCALAWSMRPLLARLHWINPVAEFFLMPNGLILMGLGLTYLFLAALLVSEAQVLVLLRRELGLFFFTPIAYIVLIGFAVIAAFLFFQFVVNDLWSDSAGLIPGQSPAREVQEPMAGTYVFGWLPVICNLFVVPVLTMHLMSEEKRTGTMEMALTAPLGEVPVVVSKFLAALFLYLLVWTPWIVYLVALRVEGREPFDYTPLLGFWLTLAIWGAAFVSMGLFFSSLTRNQIASAILTFVGMLVLTLIFFLKGYFKSDDPLTGESPIRSILADVSYIDSWFISLKGQLPVRELFVPISAAIFWLFATVKVMESRKWW
jgi:ABC-2 type transport system permease protein